MGNPMTAEGYKALEQEINHLEQDERMKLAAQIKTAREFGDLKENAEYHAAKEAAAHLESKIRRLKDQLAGATIVEKESGGGVGFGSVVEVEDIASGKTMSYTLVAAHEADVSNGMLSIESPIGEALDGCAVGDEAVFETPRGERRLKVLSVS